MTSIKKGQKYQDRERSDWGFEVLADPNSNGIFRARYRDGDTAELNDCVIDTYYDLVEEVQAPEGPKVGDKYVGKDTKIEYTVTAVGEKNFLISWNAAYDTIGEAMETPDGLSLRYTKVEPFFEEGDEWVHYSGHHYRVTCVFRRHGKMYAQVDVTRGHGDVIVALLNEVAYRDGNFRNYKKAK
jgi:hypothetical protein